MIYTVTFNPSLDYIVSVNDFKMGLTNRTDFEMLLPGGKGINVSAVLKNLGIDNTALGFCAGFTGREIRRMVEAMGVKAEFIEVENGFSRINIKLKSCDGTEINGSGPVIEKEKVLQLKRRLEILKTEDILVLAGSIPPSLPDTIYEDIMRDLDGRNIRVAVDASGELLMKVLHYRPFLIKPNHHELGEIFGVHLEKRDEVIDYAKKLQKMGAVNVLVSMAGEGAVLVSEDGNIYTAPAPKGRLVSSVGAGDSMVAGFIGGWIEKKDYRHAFCMGVAAGSASAFSESLARREDVENIYKAVKAEVL